MLRTGELVAISAARQPAATVGRMCRYRTAARGALAGRVPFFVDVRVDTWTVDGLCRLLPAVAHHVLLAVDLRRVPLGDVSHVLLRRQLALGVGVAADRADLQARAAAVCSSVAHGQRPFSYRPSAVPREILAALCASCEALRSSAESTLLDISSALAAAFAARLLATTASFSALEDRA